MVNNHGEDDRKKVRPNEHLKNKEISSPRIPYARNRPVKYNRTYYCRRAVR